MSDDENNTSYGLISEPQIADQSVGSSISTSMQVKILNSNLFLLLVLKLI